MSTPKRSQSASRLLRFPGNCVAGERQRVDELHVDVAADARLAQRELVIEERDVERRVVDDPLGASREVEELGGKVAEARPGAQILPRHAVHLGRRRVDVALGIEVVVHVTPGRAPVDQFDAGELDDAVTKLRVEPGGLGVEDDLPHSGNWDQETGISNETTSKRSCDVPEAYRGVARS